MIARIHGVLEAVEEGAALVFVESAGVTYHVLLPAYLAARLVGDIGQPVTLHTLHYFESLNQGASLVPRLAGFTSLEDRAFFGLLTTVKGIGNRKALRAMALRTDQIAAAIVDRDAALLKSLPEIGRRTAETIIAELSGKVDAFVSSGAFGGGGAAEATRGGAGAAQPGPRTAIAREALEVFLQLGENRLQAMQWIDQALQGESEKPRDVQELVQRVYVLRGGG